MPSIYCENTYCAHNHKGTCGSTYAYMALTHGSSTGKLLCRGFLEDKGYSEIVTLLGRNPRVLEERQANLKIITIDPSIEKLVKANGGYCPCAVRQTADTKCMCREFREQDTPGPCHCGRYEKVIE